MAKRYVLGEDAKNDFERMRKVPIKVSAGKLGKRLEGEDSTVWLKIVGALHLGGQGPYQWTYSGYLQTPDTVAANAGRFIDAEDTPVLIETIYNTCEANNTVSGVQGNGVNVDTLPAGFSIQPIQGSPVLPARQATLDTGVTAYFVTYENAVDGECA